MRTLSRFALGLACLPLSLAAAASPPVLFAAPQLPWWTADAGGGSVAAGGLRLDATAGQPEVGPKLVLQAGALKLRPGYWGGLCTHTPTLFADGFESSNRAGELP